MTCFIHLLQTIIKLAFYKILPSVCLKHIHVVQIEVQNCSKFNFRVEDAKNNIHTDHIQSRSNTRGRHCQNCWISYPRKSGKFPDLPLFLNQEIFCGFPLQGKLLSMTRESRYFCKGVYGPNVALGRVTCRNRAY